VSKISESAAGSTQAGEVREESFPAAAPAGVYEDWALASQEESAGDPSGMGLTIGASAMCFGASIPGS